MTVTINGRNDGPTAVDDAGAVGEDATTTIDLLANDSDPDASDELKLVEINGIAAGGTITLASGALLTINGNGTVDYDPNGQFEGLDLGESAVDSFDYTISDGNGGTATATATVTINGADDTLVADPDNASTSENAPVTIDVLANDSDADTTDNPLTINSFDVTSSGGGTVSQVGQQLVFDPGSDFDDLAIGETEIVTFNYVVENADGATATETVTVTINGRNDGPRAVDDARTTDQDTPLVIDALSNDTDPDASDSLVITGVDQPAQGSVSINAAGQLVFDPGNDFDALDETQSATVSFDYTISDGKGGTDTATLRITINGVDDATVISPDAAVTNEDTAVTIDVLGNDSDVDDVLSIAMVSQPLDVNDGLVVNNGGDVTFTPGSNFNSLAVGESATTTFTYTTNTGATETVTVTINGRNDGPTAVDDADVTDQDMVVNIDVLANDADPDSSDTLAITGVNQPAIGSVSVNASSQILFDPEGAFDSLNDGETAIVSFDYTIGDGNGGTDTATVTVTVTGIDDATAANPDNGETKEGSAVVIDVLANDSDVDDALSVVTVDDSGLPGDASVTNNGTNVTFNPGTAFNDLAEGETEIVAFTYTTNTGATETVTVTVNGVNDGPAAVDDVRSTDQDTPLVIDALSNDTDPDASDTLIIIGVDQPGFGNVSINAANQLVFDPGDEFDSLGDGETAVVSFDYTISDGKGGTDTATVTVTVNGTDDATVINPDAAVTNEDTAVTIDVLGNDSDVDDVLSIAMVSQPLDVNDGLVVNNGGDVTFTPGSNFNSLAVGESATTTFTYTTNTGATETVTVTINGRNDGPTAVDDAGAVGEDATTTIDLLANDSDPDASDELKLVEINGIAAGGTITLASGALLTINGNGTVDYDPNGQFEGLDLGESAVDSFDYTISDGNGGTATATATVTINGADDTLVADPDNASTSENAPVTIDVLANDSDADTTDNPLTINSFDVTSSGGGTVSQVGQQLVFDPGSDFDDLAIGETEIVTFNYVVENADGATATETVTVTINGRNDGPRAVDDARTTDQDTPLVIDALSNDTDPDASDSLVITGVDQPAQGSVSINAAGQLVFDPGNDFDALDETQSATVSFDYTISDGKGGTDTATLRITINGVDDATVISPDAAVTNEDTAVTIDVLGNDSDVDDVLSIAMVSQPLDVNDGLVVNNGGDVTFTPGSNFNSLAVGESATTTFTYTTNTGATETVTVTINGRNDDPTAVDDADVTDQDTVVNIDVLGAADSVAADSDPDGDTLSVTRIDGVAAGGTITLASGALVTVYGDGTVDYDPNGQFDGLDGTQSATDSFVYTISDGNGGTATATATVTITGTDDATVTNPDSDVTDEDTAVTIDVLSNDSDSDASDNPLTIASVTQPPMGQGVVSITPDSLQVIFDPGSNFDSLATGETATTSFTYETSTGVVETVTVTITGVNDDPTANPDSATTDEDSPVTIDVLGNDLAPESSDDLEVVGVTQPARGSVTYNAGDLTFDPNGEFEDLAPGETATETFTYTMSDGEGGTATSTVTVTITGADDPTVANPDSAVTNEESSVVIDVLDNDLDPDASDHPLMVSSVTQPSLGVVSIASDGSTVTFDPDGDFENLAVGEHVTVTFTYTTSTMVTETVTVTVTGANDAPTAVDDAKVTSEDSMVNIKVLTGADSTAPDTDPDGDPLSVIEIDGTTAGGTVVLSSGAIAILKGDGSIDYHPNGRFEYLDDGQTATDSFTYTVSDGHGGTSTATVTVTITGVDDPTQTTADTAQTNEETVVNIDVLSNDSDPDTSDLPLSIISVTQPAKGSVSHDGSTITFDPGTDFLSLDTGETEIVTFSYRTDTGIDEMVTVTVNGITNLKANDDTVTTDEDTALAYDPIANDDLPNAVTATITGINSNSVSAGSSVVTSAGGTVTLLPGNELSYDPSGSFDYLQVGETATDTFTYEIEGGSGLSSSATETIVIEGRNDGPTIDTLDITTIDGDPVVLTSTMLSSSDPDHPNPADLTYNVDDTIGGYFALTSNTGSAITTFTQEQVNNGEITFVPTASEPEGVLGGHVDVDTYDESGVSNGHVHEYDNKYNTSVFNYFGLEDGGLTDSVDEILLENAGIDGDTKFKILIGNADLSLGVNVSINENYDPNDPSTFVNGTVYDDTALNDLTIYSLNGVAGTTQLTSLLLSLDRDSILNAGLLPSTSGDVKDNEPGKDGEYRNGAFVIQIVAVNDDGTDAFTTNTSISNGGVQGVSTAGNGLLWESTLFWHSGIGTYDADSPFVPGDPTSIWSELDNDGIAVQLSVSDPLGLSDSDIAGVNYGSAPPVAQPDFYAVNEGATVEMELWKNDTDPTGDVLKVTHINGVLLPRDYPVTLANGATVVLGLDGKIDYTSANNSLDVGESATETFIYTVTDNKGATDTETVTVTVNGRESPLVSNNDSANTSEDSSVTIDVLANDSDPDTSDGPLSVVSVTQPTVGSVVNNGADVTFDPGTGFDYLTDGESATVTFTYTVANADGATRNETVTVTVNGVDDATIAAADSATISPIVSTQTSGGATAANTITAGSVDVVVTDNGTVSDGIDATFNTINAWSNPAIPGGSSYQLSYDGTGAGTITFTFSEEVTNPVLHIDRLGGISGGDNTSVWTLATAGTTLTRLAGSTDFVVTSSSFQQLLTSTTDASTESSLDDNSGAAAGSVRINGTFTSLTFNLTMAGDPGTGDAVEIAFDVTHHDYAPTSVNVLANDSDADAADNPLAVVGLSDPTLGSVSTDGTNVIFDPGTDFEYLKNGESATETITYTLNTGATGTVTFTVNGASSPHVPPIVIDMDGDGVEFDGVEDGILMDVDGDGELEQTAWADEDDAVLIYDKNDNNDVDGPEEFAFARYSNDPNATDLDGLRHFDTNEDLILDANDAEFDSFKLWQDRDGDGIVDEGEMMTLREAGIESLELTSDGISYEAAEGDIFVHGEAGVNYADGTKGTLADAEFVYEELAAEDHPIEVLTDEGEVINLSESETAIEDATPDLVVESPEPGFTDHSHPEEGGAVPPTTAEEDAAAADAAMS